MRQRTKALQMLKQIRAIGIGPRTQNAVGEVTEKRIHAKLKWRDYVGLEPIEARKEIVRKFIPSRVRSGTVAIRRSMRRIASPKTARAAKRLFGEEGQYGLMVLHPELFASTQVVRQFIKALGVTPVLNKTFVFNKTTFLETYPQAFKYTKEKDNFPVFAANVQSGPNKVIVFKLPKSATGEEKERILKELKEDIRASITSPLLENHGLYNGKFTKFGKALDATGYVRKQKPTRTNTLLQYSGVHIPDAKTMVREALMLLSKDEINIIENLR